MKDGTAKKLAQIDLDYQKRARAIQEAEKSCLSYKKRKLMPSIKMTLRLNDSLQDSR